MKTALILSAGFGTRLSSLSETCPKPLLYLKNKAHIENILDSLIELGFETFIINTHHLPEKFEEAFPQRRYRGKTLILSQEENILDTGGAIKNILLKDIISENEPILVYNGDILFEGDLSVFIANNEPNNAAKLLVLNEAKNKNLAIKDEYVVDLRFKRNVEYKSLAGFAGIFIANPKFLNLSKSYPLDKFSSVDIFLELLSKKESLKAHQGDPAKWSDIGSYCDYINCQLQDRQLNKDYLESLEINSVKIVEKGASDRKFFKLKTKDKALVACVYQSQKAENALYANLAIWLKEQDICVPNIELFEPRNNLIIMQDCSDLDLAQASTNLCEKDILKLYAKAFNEIQKLHSLKESPKEICEEFSHALYAWEQNYFKENFIEELCSLSPILCEKELFKLAQELLDTHPAIVHRDFQSQNIMISDESLFFIDFQGMRWGNKYYDLASIIFDSYTDFSIEFREKLFDISGYSDRNIFYKASCQRLMQALGAYCFLSLKKGKKEYAKYIGKAFKLLKYCAKKAELKSLIAQLEKCELKID